MDFIPDISSTEKNLIKTIAMMEKGKTLCTDRDRKAWQMGSSRSMARSIRL